MAYLFAIDELPLRINARGEWLHGGERLHPRVEALFRRSLVVEQDGSYGLAIQFRRAAVEVDDTAFFVTRADVRVAGGARGVERVELWISDGASEALDPATLMQGPDNVLYARIFRSGASVPCRFTAQQYHELALHMELDPGDGAAILEVGGRAFRVGSYEPRPVRTVTA